MTHIGCNSKNSFAIDQENNLYSWGSCETSLLGYISESDIITPRKIKVKNGYDEYTVNQINVGQFHVAVIADRNDKIKKSFDEIRKSLNFAKQYFIDIKQWFYENIKNVYSYEQFILFLIRAERKKQNENINYNDFEKLFLKPFFAYLKINGKDFYHMEEAYFEKIKMALNLNDTKLDFTESDLKTFEEKEKDIHNFSVKFCKHFNENPRDFQLFAKLVFQFKPLIDENDIKELFDYLGEKTIDIDTLREIIQILQINEKAKNNLEEPFDRRKIESNILIDCILEEQTGKNNVFTWGIQTEGRLGYNEVDENFNTNNNNNINNNDGQEEIKYQQIPKLVHFPTKIISVACGFYHSLALSDKSEVYSWGSSRYGCLGKYHKKFQPIPKIIDKDIEGHDFNNIIQVSAGMYLSMALNKDGIVFTWGLGNNGRLGHGDENSVEKPKKIEYFDINKIKIKQISCGDLHCACISTAKELYTFGNGNYGKLGHCNYDHVFTPSKVGFFSMQKVENVACGSYNTVAVTTDAKVYAWGKNSHGMLGVPHQQEQNILVPSEVQYQKDNPDLVVSEIAIGSMHQLLLCTDGTLFSCGNSVNGILGIEDVIDKVTVPTKIINTKPFYKTTHTDIMKENHIFKKYTPYFSLEAADIRNPNISIAIVFADASNFNSAFITNNGELYMSGEKFLIPEEKKEGQGSNTTPDNTPFGLYKKDYIFKINYFREKVSYIALGKYHAICVAEFKAYAWGKNIDGSCGITGKGQGEIISEPTLIDGIKTTVKMACVSDDHSLVLTQNGEIYAFGNNMYGKLGVGDLNRYFIIGVKPSENEPILVKNVTHAQFIACSNTHCACVMRYNQNLQDSYSVYTWGSGFGGKLGHSNGVDVYEPKIVEELEHKNKEDGKKPFFIKVACGEDFTLALDEKGKLWGWGKIKFLPFVKIGDIEGKTESPIQILEKFSFKFISAKGNLACAISMKGEMYSWGEIIFEDTIKKIDFGLVTTEKIEFVSVGFNHNISIDMTYTPYTWGSNLFHKCGYENISNEKIEFIPKPKRIEYFYEQFEKNKDEAEIEEKAKNIKNNNNNFNYNFTYEINTNSNQDDLNNKLRGGKNDNLMENNNDNINDNENYNNDYNYTKGERRDETQIKLLDESPENKNIGLMVKDIKINEEFFEIMKSFFKTMRMLENQKIKLYVDTQDKINQIINLSQAAIKKKYSSIIPMILSHNFQHYETFMCLLYNHPCYLEKLYNKNENIKLFLEIIDIIYGKNEIFLHNQRIIINLLGLWNSIFPSFEFGRENEYEDSILYYLYDKIYDITEQNMRITGELISIVFLHIISEILEREEKYIEFDMDAADKINELFKNLRKKDKEEIFEKNTIEIIKQYLENKFKDMNDNISGYSYGVYWILSRITKKFKKSLKSIEQNTEGQKKKRESINYILNYFIFQPCSKLLKKILDSNQSNLPKEYEYLGDSLLNTLIKFKDDENFYKLYNLYHSKQKEKEKDKKEDNKNQDNIKFYELVLPTCEMLKEVADYFNKLSHSTFQIKGRFDFLINYKFDFTLNAVKEITKTISERGNELISIPLSIQNLVKLQKTFQEITSDLDIKDPLRIILTDMNDFSLEQLDSTSVINNIPINLTFNPYEFYFRDDIDIDMVKCSKCILPVPHIFVSEKERNECKNGPNWICPKCKRENEGTKINCDKCNSNYIKGKEHIKSGSLFFKRYFINKNNDLTLGLEEVLYILPPLYKNADIINEIDKEYHKIKDANIKDNKKEKLFEKIRSDINKFKDEKNIKNDKELIDIVKQDIEINYSKRQQHIMYLKKINEIISIINQLIETSKTNYDLLTKKIQSLNSNVSKGYVTTYFVSFNNFVDKIPKSINQPKNSSKIFLARDLIDNNVIQEILYDKKEQPKLVQKTYIEFQKVKNGYKMLISYKEKFKKFVVCGTTKHDYKLNEDLISNKKIFQLRRIARHNPVVEFGDISFNSFYLVLLLYQLAESV